MADFKLSREHRGHTGDVRAVTAFPSTEQSGEDEICSSSRDGTIRTWIDPRTWTPHEGFVNAIAYMHCTDGSHFIVSGGKDGMVQATPVAFGTESFSMVGHTDNICALDAWEDMVVSGSWDKTARVWKGWECVHHLTGHEAAVWAVLCVNEETVLTGSADKSIRMWTHGKQTAAFPGHTDCVRALTKLGDGFASAGNDAAIIIWKLDGQRLRTLSGHTSFIYSLTTLSSGELVSSGEDRTLRVWNADGMLLQSITHPAISVWCVASTSKGDIVSGASDAVVRVFSRDPSRYADEAGIKAFEDEVASSAIPAGTIGDIKKESLPDAESALNKPGKEGQTIMVRSGNTVEAHQFSSGRWQKIGEVVDAVGSNRKQLYNGIEYDYVFDVDIQEGLPALKLPYNATENPYDAARHFLEINELPITYLEQVAKFIESNTGGVKLGVQEAYKDPFQDGGDVSSPTTTPRPSATALLPHSEYLLVRRANLDVIMKKITDFNTEEGSMDVVRLENLNRLCQQLDTKPRPDAELLHKGIDECFVMLSSWQLNRTFPALDLLRVLVLSPDADIESTFGRLLQQTSPWKSETNSMLALRCVINAFATSRGAKYVTEEGLPAILAKVDMFMLTTNKNLRVATTTLLLNLTVYATKQPLEVHAISNMLMTLLMRETDSEAVYRGLVGLGNIVIESPHLSGPIRACVASIRSDLRKEQRIQQIIDEIQSIN